MWGEGGKGIIPFQESKNLYPFFSISKKTTFFLLQKIQQVTERLIKKQIGLRICISYGFNWDTVK